MPFIPPGEQVSTVEVQPLIAVRNVRASSRWYSRLLRVRGASRASPPGRLRQALLVRTVLQLHAWDEEDHPNLVNRSAARPGHGVLLWFTVEDFHAAVERARKLGAEVVEDAHVNPAPNQWEIWLRDPDGYVVVIAGPTGGAAETA